MKNNLKWIALGVLGLLLFSIFSASIVFFVMKLMKGEAYQLSLTAVTEHPEVIAVVGNPIIPSWYVLGSVHTSGPDGSASLEYSIEGSVSSGKVYAYATKTIGEWRLDIVVVSVSPSDKQITVIGDRE
jgi:hypothetical protein